MLEKNLTHDYCFKIILIGHSGVGKTSILKKYVNKIFQEEYQCTFGVDYFIKKFEFLGQRISLNIWDTAGQEKYRALNKSYYLGSDACFIVFDLTSYNSFKDLDEWYDDFCNNSEKDAKNNIVALGNKCDLINEKEINKEDIDEFINKKNLKYFETSAKEGKNIDECFDYIMKKLITQFNMNNINDKNNLQNSSYNKFFINNKEKEKNISSNQESNKCC